MDGFESRGNIKVLMATNRPDTLDPALMRPGRIDRKIEFSLPDLEGRVNIFKIHAKHMSVEKGIRYELLARLCPNTTGAEIRSVCTEAGMFAIRARHKAITEKDLIQAIDKVIKGYKKFSATGKYMVYNWWSRNHYEIIYILINFKIVSEIFIRNNLQKCLPEHKEIYIINKYLEQFPLSLEKIL